MRSGAGGPMPSRTPAAPAPWRAPRPDESAEQRGLLRGAPSVGCDFGEVGVDVCGGPDPDEHVWTGAGRRHADVADDGAELRATGLRLPRPQQTAHQAQPSVSGEPPATGTPDTFGAGAAGSPTALLPRYGVRMTGRRRARRQLRRRRGRGDGRGVRSHHGSLPGGHRAGPAPHPSGRGRPAHVARVRPLGRPRPRGAWAWHPFGGEVTGHRTFDGVTIPSAGRIGWFVGTDRWPDREFFRYRITELHLVTTGAAPATAASTRWSPRRGRTRAGPPGTRSRSCAPPSTSRAVPRATCREVRGGGATPSSATTNRARTRVPSRGRCILRAAGRTRRTSRCRRPGRAARVARRPDRAGRPHPGRGGRASGSSGRPSVLRSDSAATR
jgi:hypothetical protein